MRFLFKAIVRHTVPGLGQYQRAFHFISSTSDGEELEEEAIRLARDNGIDPANVVSCNLYFAGLHTVEGEPVTVTIGVHQ